MSARRLFTCGIALLLAWPAIAAAAIQEEGQVAAVTVYQGQALVTRQIQLEQAAGLTEIIVTNLPDKVQPESLYAEGAEGVTIRSVRYRVRPVRQDVRREVRELDEQIQAAQDNLHANQRMQQLLNERLEYLQPMQAFTTSTANQELRSGVLNAETLKSLTEFVFEQRAEIAQQQLEQAIEQRELQSELETLQRERNVLTQGSAKTVREAVVFADLGEGGAKALSLTYLVTDASWSPSYNLRANSQAGQVTVEYNASIQQRSGEDWTGVAMTLSTATPSLIATAPELEALAIRLSAPTPKQRQAQREYAKAKDELLRQQRVLSKLRNHYSDAFLAQQTSDSSSIGLQAELGDLFAADEANGDGVALGRAIANAPQSAMVRSGGRGGFGGVFSEGSGSADLGLNSLGCALQLLEFNNDAPRISLDRKRPQKQGISVSYQLTDKTSLPSRSDRQLIQIAALPLEGEFYHLAMPVLTEYVYKEALLTNCTDMVLLAGPSATFLDDEFVGRGDLPTIASGEPFKVGLGIDTSLRAGRELVKKHSRTQGGNRIQELNYRLTIENFGNEQVAIRLMDRMPKPRNSEITVTLVDSDQPISQDALYQKEARQQGILRWDLSTDAGQKGLKATELHYTLRLEHDKELQVTGLAGK